MTLEEATNLIGRCAARMNDLYRKVVFDEWVIVSLIQHKAKILAYLGPRKDDFQKNFATDVQDLRADLLSRRHSIGDFEFARHGVGTRLEAFVMAGEGLYLICNNTAQSMSAIAKDQDLFIKGRFQRSRPR